MQDAASNSGSLAEKIAAFLGAAVGLFMRAVDWLTGKRKTWHEER